MTNKTTDDFANELSRLRPASHASDLPDVMYAAGMAAGRKASRFPNSDRPRKWQLAVTAVLAASFAGIVAVPASYRAGANSTSDSPLEATSLNATALKPPAQDAAVTVVESTSDRNASKLVATIVENVEASSTMLPTWLGLESKRDIATTLTAFHGSDLLRQDRGRLGDFSMSNDGAPDISVDEDRETMSVGSSLRASVDDRFGL